MAKNRETVETVADLIFSGCKITVDSDYNHEIKKCLLLGRKAMTNLDSILKSRDIALSTKGLYSQSYGFSTHCVWMWELGHKEGWAWKKWCFKIVVMEKTLESPLGCKEFKPAIPKGNQPWVFTGRTGAEGSILSLATWCQEQTHWKTPWYWERLKAGGEGDNRRWDG